MAMQAMTSWSEGVDPLETTRTKATRAASTVVVRPVFQVVKEKSTQEWLESGCLAKGFGGLLKFAVGQCGQAFEHASHIAMHPQAFVEFVHRQRA